MNHGDVEPQAPAARRLGGPGYEVVEAALQTIERHRMLSVGDKVVVAVSGGPDSSCLLDVLRRVSVRIPHVLVVAHLDHGLSRASAQVAARVEEGARQAGLEFHLEVARELEGPNLHARARAFRYDFFDRLLDRLGADRLATGHTLDDRAETTLARLIHGGGTRALAGLAPAQGSRIRPLIGVRRLETRRYCNEAGIAFFDDPANNDVRFERAAVRTNVLAAIERHWGDGAVRALAQSAERLGEDATAIEWAAETASEDVLSVHEGETFLDREGLLRLPRAVRRRLLERAVGRVRDRSGGIEAALDALEAGYRTGLRFSVASGKEIVFERSGVRVLASPERTPPASP